MPPVLVVSCEDDANHTHGHPLPEHVPEDVDVSIVFEDTCGTICFTPHSPKARTFFASKGLGSAENQEATRDAISDGEMAVIDGDEINDEPLDTADHWRTRKVVLPLFGAGGMVAVAMMEVEMLVNGLTCALTRSHFGIISDPEPRIHRPTDRDIAPLLRMPRKHLGKLPDELWDAGRKKLPPARGSQSDSVQ